jgi:branched-chain amino acid aminotransferase
MMSRVWIRGRTSGTGRFFRSFSTLEKFDLKSMQIKKVDKPGKLPDRLETLQFGHTFSDHMFEIDWNKEKGWHNALISPFHNLSLHPACSVLHYAIECFEGLKSYKDANGSIRLFRPNKNYERMQNSARRLALPTFDQEGYMQALTTLLKLDKQFIPQVSGYSLYVRPTLIGTSPFLGVAPARHAKFYIICSPVGPYYKGGWKPVKLLADDKYVRAWPGGVGSAKIGGNYAPSIFPQMEAEKKGYAQVLWLYGSEYYVTEVGTMNLFVFWINGKGEKELRTAPLDGTILPGVTRDSILTLTRKWNEFKVTEESYTIHDIISAVKEGRIIEIFGAGTAAVVSPVELIGFKGTDYVIPIDKDDPKATIGKLSKRIADTL